MWAFNIYIEICRTCGGVVEIYVPRYRAGADALR